MYNGCLESKPCFQCIPYFSEKVDQLPAHPVLGILHFSFHSGVDILKPSQPASLLWWRSVEFVSTIPGFQGLSWAPVHDASPNQQIIVLIQWTSQQSWKLFQTSLGFSMMLGYISTISNRCIQLALPSGISGFACHLELVSFKFSTMLSTTQLDKKAEFKAKWEMAFSPHLNHATNEAKLISACGEWLEKDYDSENPFFAGLLFWKSDTQATSPQLLREANVYNVADHLERLVGDAIEVTSVYTSQLHHISSDFFRRRPNDPYPDPVQFQTEHQLFKIPVKPKYNTNESKNPGGKDGFHLESMIQARLAERIAVAPAGIWYPMGVISQYYLPRQPNSSSNANIEMISFFAQTGNARVATSFADLRKKLWGLGDCPPLVWGKNQSNKEENDNFLLFISMFSFFFLWRGKILATLIFADIKD
ncbi:hypothetical protein PITC_005910 [Penicillium italicum]|uniref:Uncharacterized protein n=1 Tax=Penicillium italicum TaxID=40296 RepID=A0A0A2LD03_PENIT|nr:hypothetical protein PITC_005910 [Penicillium italicum]